ncbi:pyridoxal phosphate-dependent transferase [Xylaria digitata]|nr:pyridoxal phosphate-dependent transferase [Xylaria digitata]
MKTPTKSQSLPLGHSLPPGDRHAVSVSLPTWDNIVQYMKGDTKIHENLQADYPRYAIDGSFSPWLFYQHASVRRLNEAVLARLNAPEDTRCVIFLSEDGMRRCVQFLRENTDVESSIQEVSFTMPVRAPPAGEDVWARFHAVLFHERAADRAAEFWGCFGDGISSRHAEYCYERLPFMHPVSSHPSSSAPSLEEVPLASWHHSDADTKEKLKASIANYVTSEKSSQELVSPRDVFLYAKGMCAIGTLARHLVPTSEAASEAVVFGWPYGSTPKCVKSSGYERFTFYSQGSSAELDELQSSLAAGRRISCLFCEIPSNPLCATPDLHRIRSLADKYHFVVVCDETIGTFINVDVLPYVDVVLTSLTKMFNGAANVMGGSIVINPNSAYYAELHAKLGADHEDLLFPLDAQVLLQNSLSFPARVRQANRSALLIANFLKTHELVAQVNYPTLVSSKDLYEQYRRPEGGYGSLISFVLKSPESAVAFYDAVDLCKGPSFGANFTLILPYSQLAHAHELDWAESKGLAKHIIRLSVGLEDTNGLVAKIGEALRRAEGRDAVNGRFLKTVNPSTMKALQSLDRSIEWGQPGTARNDFRCTCCFLS